MYYNQIKFIHFSNSMKITDVKRKIIIKMFQKKCENLFCPVLYYLSTTPLDYIKYLEKFFHM